METKEQIAVEDWIVLYEGLGLPKTHQWCILSLIRGAVPQRYSYNPFVQFALCLEGPLATIVGHWHTVILTAHWQSSVLFCGRRGHVARFCFDQKKYGHQRARKNSSIYGENSSIYPKIAVFMAKYHYLWQNNSIYGKIAVFMAKIAVFMAKIAVLWVNSCIYGKNNSIYGKIAVVMAIQQHLWQNSCIMGKYKYLWQNSSIYGKIAVLWVNSCIYGEK